MMNADPKPPTPYEVAEREQMKARSDFDAMITPHIAYAIEFAEKMRETGLPSGFVVSKCILIAIGESLMRKAKAAKEAKP